MKNASLYVRILTVMVIGSLAGILVLRLANPNGISEQGMVGFYVLAFAGIGSLVAGFIVDALDVRSR